MARVYTHGGPRPNSGRPKTLEGGKTVSVNLDAETLAKLSAMAETAKQSRSEVVRGLIKGAE